MIIDGHNLLFRMFFGMPNKICDDRGNDIRAVIGFTGSLLKIIKREVPCHICVVFDSETKSERFADPEYKANRVTDYRMEEENPFDQLEDIRKCLEILHICWLEQEAEEGDDMIASIAEQAKMVMDEIIIVSTDKDFFQLVDSKIKVQIPRGKLTVVYGESEIRERFGIGPEQYADYCALAGDPSDHIRGINGIGKVTAGKLLKKYGSITDIMKNLDKESAGIRRKLEGQEKVLKHNLYLVTINPYRKVDVDFQAMRLGKVEYKTMDVLKKAGCISEKKEEA